MAATLNSVSLNGVTISAATAPPPPAIIDDSFTAPDLTLLEDYVPSGPGGSWTMKFGDPETMIIGSNQLRRSTDAEFGVGVGTSGAYLSTVVPSTVTITFNMTIRSDNDSSIEFVRNGTIFGNADKFFSYFVHEADDDDVQIGANLSDSTTVASLAIGTPYAFKIEILSTSITLYINDVLVLTGTSTPGYFTGPFGISLFDSLGVGAIAIDNLKVVAL